MRALLVAHVHEHRLVGTARYCLRHGTAVHAAAHAAAQRTVLCAAHRREPLVRFEGADGLDEVHAWVDAPHVQCAHVDCLYADHRATPVLRGAA